MKNNIKIATIISYVALFAGNLISLIYTPFMLVTLGKSEYGIFSLVNTIISYIYLLDMGFGNAIIRYNSKYMAKNDKEGLEKINGMFLLLYCLIAVVATIVGYLIFLNLDKIFSNGLTLNEINLTKSMFIIAVINLALSFPLGVFNGIIMANERFVFTKFMNLVRTVLNPVIMVVVLVFGYKALGMVIASSIFNIFLGVINVFYCFKVLKVKFMFRSFDKNLYKEIFKFSFFIFLTAIASKIYWSTDQFILGMTVSAASISVYTIGTQFNGYFTALSNVIGGMFLPKITKITTVKESKDELMDLLIRVSRIQFYIAAFVLMGFILVGKSFIKRWAGTGYEDSYYIAIIVMAPQLVSIIQMLFATMLEAMNKHKVKSYIYLFVAILNLILTIILVQYLGAIGCAIGTAIGMVINAVLNNIYYKYYLKLDMTYYWRKVLTPIVAMIISFVSGIILVKLIKPSGYLDIAIFGILFTLMYLVLLYKLSFNDYEKNIFKLILSKVNYKKIK